MKSHDIRSRYLKFFEKRGHAIVPSAPLVPENDPTTLFTGSGMQPMVPYLLGEAHPLGTRIADSQKSFRTVDIDEVGDNRHTTFFEMLGNWSLGDYFKKDQIEWMFQFLTEEIGIDPNKLYVTAFIGDEKNHIPKDTEAAALWKKLFAQKGIETKEVEIGSEENGYQVGMQGGRIFYYDAKKNWWSRAGVPEKMPAGEPGGADSEMFFEFSDVAHDTKFGPHCHPNCDCGRFLEIGNNVFMEYKKNVDGTFSKLPKSNVDFGGGLERLAMATADCADIIEVNHRPILDYIESVSGKKYGVDAAQTKAFRIIADHMKASVFLIADGVLPSNTDQGYYVRRLLRRAVRFSDSLGVTKSVLSGLVEVVVSMYQEAYPELVAKTESVRKEIEAEEERFRKTLKDGLKVFDEFIRIKSGIVSTQEQKNEFFKQPYNNVLTSEQVFKLITTYGFPKELIKEEVSLRKITVDSWDEVDGLLEAHRALSRAGAAQKFKSGLADADEMSVKYHTATHLLHQALRDVLGTHVQQKGSNITAERLRFDFAHGTKMTDDEKKRVEAIINEKISAALPMQVIELPKAEAEKLGALHFFGDKYGDKVTVYFIGGQGSGIDAVQTAYSNEFCGGPHVKNTKELAGPAGAWRFKIAKEEAVSAGVRRIKAVLA